MKPSIRMCAVWFAGVRATHYKLRLHRSPSTLCGFLIHKKQVPVIFVKTHRLFCIVICIHCYVHIIFWLPLYNFRVCHNVSHVQPWCVCVSSVHCQTWGCCWRRGLVVGTWSRTRLTPSQQRPMSAGYRRWSEKIRSCQGNFRVSQRLAVSR